MGRGIGDSTARSPGRRPWGARTRTSMGRQVLVPVSHKLFATALKGCSCFTPPGLSSTNSATSGKPPSPSNASFSSSELKQLSGSHAASLCLQSRQASATFCDTYNQNRSCPWCWRLPPTNGVQPRRTAELLPGQRCPGPSHLRDERRPGLQARMMFPHAHGGRGPVWASWGSRHCASSPSEILYSPS